MSHDPVQMADDFAVASDNRDLDERERRIRELASKPTWDIDCAPELNELLDALGAAREQNGRLREALGHFGTHDSSCVLVNRHAWEAAGRPPTETLTCSCGLTAALAREDGGKRLITGSRPLSPCGRTVDPTEETTDAVWLSSPTGGVAHRRRDCPRLVVYIDNSQPAVSVSARLLPEFPGLVEVPSIARSRRLHRTIRLCARCGHADR